jgi:hypothetical protein
MFTMPQPLSIWQYPEIGIFWLHEEFIAALAQIACTFLLSSEALKSFCPDLGNMSFRAQRIQASARLLQRLLGRCREVARNVEFMRAEFPNSLSDK